MSTGGAHEGTMKQMVAASRVGDHQQHTNQPTYGRLLVEVTPLTELTSRRSALGLLGWCGHRRGVDARRAGK